MEKILNRQKIKIMCAFDEMVPIAEVKPNPKNPNKHPEAQITALANLIKHIGWRSPITVSNRSGLVVRGHGRLMAAERLGLVAVPVDLQDYASEADEWTDLIADNYSAELSVIDETILKDILQDIDSAGVDLVLTTIEVEKINKLLGKWDDIETTENPELPDGEKLPFRQMTFTVHDKQYQIIDSAIKNAKNSGDINSDLNENSNGNALALICEVYNGRCKKVDSEADTIAKGKRNYKVAALQ